MAAASARTVGATVNEPIPAVGIQLRSQVKEAAYHHQKQSDTLTRSIKASLTAPHVAPEDFSVTAPIVKAIVDSPGKPKQRPSRIPVAVKGLGRLMPCAVRTSMYSTGILPLVWSGS